MAKRIMTVDDSATIRTMLNLTLTHAGYEVIEARDGDEALALLEAGSVDLLVTDLNMPNMDGIALASAARKIPGQCNIFSVNSRRAICFENDQACKLR